MSKIRAYKLFHTYEPQDSKIYFTTTMDDDHLIKLIKIWQMKLSDIVPEFDWGVEDMMELLETFGCKRVSEAEVAYHFGEYYEANLYNIWEYKNTWWPEEDWVKPEFNNPNTDSIFQRVIQENKDNLGEVWEQWAEREQAEKNRKKGLK